MPTISFVSGKKPAPPPPELKVEVPNVAKTKGKVKTPKPEPVIVEVVEPVKPSKGKTKAVKKVKAEVEVGDEIIVFKPEVKTKPTKKVKEPVLVAPVVEVPIDIPTNARGRPRLGLSDEEKKLRRSESQNIYHNKNREKQNILRVIRYYKKKNADIPTHVREKYNLIMATPQM
jgi:hypothetical protein